MMIHEATKPSPVTFMSMVTTAMDQPLLPLSTPSSSSPFTSTSKKRNIEVSSIPTDALSILCHVASECFAQDHHYTHNKRRRLILHHRCASPSTSIVTDEEVSSHSERHEQHQDVAQQQRDPASTSAWIVPIPSLIRKSSKHGIATTSTRMPRLPPIGTVGRPLRLPSRMPTPEEAKGGRHERLGRLQTLLL